MTLIVDGMNVIGTVPDGWWKDRTAAMRRLAGRLQPGTLLVLDGRRRPVEAPKGVDVRFTPVADDLIAELAREGDTVVTSDRGLIDRLPAGCEVVPARAFRVALDHG